MKRAMVAGVTPWVARMVSTSLAMLRLVGYGIPCVIMVDSAHKLLGKSSKVKENEFGAKPSHLAQLPFGSVTLKKS